MSSLGQFLLYKVDVFLGDFPSPRWGGFSFLIPIHGLRFASPVAAGLHPFGIVSGTGGITVP